MRFIQSQITVQLAPRFILHCLWVGAVLLSSVATTEYYLGKKDRNNFTKREQFVARMLTF